MNVQEAYSQWSEQYDTNANRTRDAEALALQKMLEKVSVKSTLEIGCGTGKNTGYLLTKGSDLLAIDLTEAMLVKAREKLAGTTARFVQADIKQEWHFTTEQYDLITFSLVLEHIENLNFIFEQAVQKLGTGGYVYVGELHPYKQYAGTKARFDTAAGRTEVECYTHHLSDFTRAAKNAGLQLIDIQEFFDEGERQAPPRILALLFRLSPSEPENIS